MRFVNALMFAGLAYAGAAPFAHADSIPLDLSGLQDREEIQTYFDGGTGGNGSTGGANLGVTFTAGSTAQTNGVNDGFANVPAAANGAAAYFNQFAAGADVYLDDPTGFTGGFSFWYSNGSGGTVEVDLYSGVDGTGSLVGSILLSSNNNVGDCDPSISYCEWSVGGTSFAGTVESVDFTGANDTTFNNLETLFSDITIGSAQPAPEPASLAMFAAGVALVGRVRRRKRG